MRIAMTWMYGEASAGNQAGEEHAQARYLDGLSTALAGSGHEVRVYVRRRKDPGVGAHERPGVRVIPVPVGPVTPLGEKDLLRCAGEFGRWVGASWRDDRWVPQVVHAHSWLGGLAGLTARGEAAVPVPVVLSYHTLGDSPHRPEHGAEGRLAYERVLGRQVDLVIADCTEQGERLVRLGLPRRAIRLVCPGVDLDRFTPVGPAALKPDRQRILAFGDPAGDGGLAGDSGLADVVHAMRAIPGAELVVLDQDSGPHDALAARALRRLVNSEGVADRVRLVRRVSRAALPAWYRSGDLLAWPGRSDPAGQSSVEAMACGVPVVGYRVGGLMDSVIDGVTGVVVPWHNVRALTVAMRNLLRDSRRRWAIAAAAADRAQQCYSWSCAAGQMLSAYRRLDGLASAGA